MMRVALPTSARPSLAGGIAAVLLLGMLGCEPTPQQPTPDPHWIQNWECDWLLEFQMLRVGEKTPQKLGISTPAVPFAVVPVTGTKDEYIAFYRYCLPVDGIAE